MEDVQLRVGLKLVKSWKCNIWVEVLTEIEFWASCPILLIHVRIRGPISACEGGVKLHPENVGFTKNSGIILQTQKHVFFQ